METLTGDHWKIHVGDVMEGLAAIPSGSVHCVVTSPPYWGLRDYGYEGQIGSENTPQEFVAVLVRVFAEVKRILRDDGVCFINLGDSYATGAGSAKNPGSASNADAFPRSQPNRMNFGLAAGNAIGVPWRVALGLQDDGWILRSEIIWSKPSPMPESVSGWRWKRCMRQIEASKRADAGTYHSESTNGKPHGACPGCEKCESNGGYCLSKGSWRPTKSHESIFMLTKQSGYFSDGDTSKEAAVGGTGGAGLTKALPRSKENERICGKGHAQIKQAMSQHSVETRNMRTVWRISSESYKDAHFATYPTELVRRCLISGTSRGGRCEKCGSQLAPIVDTERRATRPGHNSKVNRVSRHLDSPYQDHAGSIYGNRDPNRHTTVSKVLGYLATCECNVGPGRPIVLDPFGGSMTTGQVAINMGCDFIGCEANLDYAKMGIKRMETPWVPVADRKKKSTKPRRKKCKRQAELF